MAAPKPPSGSPLAGPYARYLLSAILVQEGPTNFIDSANPANTGVAIGNPIVVTNQLAYFPGQSAIVGWTDPVPNSPMNPTVMIRFRPDALGPYQTLYGNNSFSFAISGSKFGWYNQAFSTGDIVTDRLQTITMRRNGITGVVDYYLDGVFDSTRFGLGTPFPSDDLNPLGVGGTTSMGVFSLFAGDLDYVYIFDDLPVDAIPILTADPFSIFKPMFQDGIPSHPVHWLEHFY